MKKVRTNKIAFAFDAKGEPVRGTRPHGGIDFCGHAFESLPRRINWGHSDLRIRKRAVSGILSVSSSEEIGTPKKTHRQL